MASIMLRGASALVSRPCAVRAPFQTALAPLRAPVVQRRALQVVAAEPEKKVEKKRTPQPEKRAKLAEGRRLYNKSRKSACATRVKKVIKMAGQLAADVPKAQAGISDLERLISEAFSEIDKAIVKGILHKNNGARKKARCSRYKKKVLLAAGLWTPPAEHADYGAWLRLQKSAPAAQKNAPVATA